MISKCNDDDLTRHLWILQAFTESLVGSLRRRRAAGLLRTL